RPKPHRLRSNSVILATIADKYKLSINIIAISLLVPATPLRPRTAETYFMPSIMPPGCGRAPQMYTANYKTIGVRLRHLVLFGGPGRPGPHGHPGYRRTPV